MFKYIYMIIYIPASKLLYHSNVTSKYVSAFKIGVNLKILWIIGGITQSEK